MDAETIVALVVAVLGIIGTILQTLGKQKEAELLEAVMRGVETTARGSAVKKAIASEATDAGVQGALAERVEEMFPKEEAKP